MKSRISITLETRKKILDLYEKKCAGCLSEGMLHIHHINEDPKDNRYHNLIVLCPKCHKKIHRDGIIPDFKMNKDREFMVRASKYVDDLRKRKAIACLEAYERLGTVREAAAEVGVSREYARKLMRGFDEGKPRRIPLP